MLRITRFVASGLIAIATIETPAAMSADALPGGKGIDVMTRYMQRVSALEADLHAAVVRHDAKALDKLLSPFFEIRRPNGVIVQRESWLAEGDKPDGNLRDLSVYEVGDSAIANFALRSTAGSERFVVDVWVHKQDEWRLRVRFETLQVR